MRVAEALILAVQFAVVSGRLTLLTGKEELGWYNHGSRELVCVSDDDGAGLTWNSNLNWKESYYEFSDRQDVNSFQNPNEPRSRSLLDCELNQNDGCTLSWRTEGWSLTSSIGTPMGPVLDRRWEGFREINILDRYDFLRTMQTPTFVVSIRGTADGYILICEDKNLHTKSCYWIVIGGWVNTKSVIRKCAQGVPEPPKYPKESCAQARDNIMHTPLSPFEWKTFVVTWNESTRTISVYDSKGMILTFVDSEERSSKQNTNYHLFLRSMRPALFRLHTYNFLRTTDPGVVLVSPELSVTTTNFCVEMAVGLCAECQLELTLADPSTERVEHILEVTKGFPTVHGLPGWQYVRVNKSLSSGNSRVKLRMVTILKQETPNPLWAVANVRSCPPADSIRKGRMKATQDKYEWQYYWPNVTCQRLFYKENTVVNSLPPATVDVKFADSDCPLGKVGPYCSISCTDDLQLQADCSNAKICEEPGCTCSPGYIGPHCDKSSNLYINACSMQK